MRTKTFCLKVEGLNNLKEEDLKKVFKRLSSKNLEILLSQNIIYFNTHNGKVINYIYEGLNNLIDNNISLDFVEPNDINQIASLVFPLPENEKIYDIVSINIDKDNIIEKQDNITNLKDTIVNSVFCKCCFKSTPKEIDFCIYCSFDIKKEESVSDYHIKINKISHEARIKLSKYFSEISSNDYNDILNSFNNLPVIVEFKSSGSFLEQILSQLEFNNISYNLLEYSLEKFIYKLYSSINLGYLEDSYITRSNAKLIKDTMKAIRSQDLKNAISNSLYQAYQIINHLRHSDKTSYFLLKDMEIEINKVLEQFMSLIKRVDKLEIYLSENSISQIEKEIIKIEEKISLSDNIVLKKLNLENLDLKNQELKEMTKIIDNYQVLNHQIDSIKELFKSLRTKVAYINTYDIQTNKGNYKELNNIKFNLINKIKAIDEVLRY